ncbi:MAG: divergent polysaccharide deacetylase family protein [Candidatus Omnitrophica bacterium]|nr:divergent polysaccharide deacetylase family protein [Candidatus Omnitrophota bacterium]MDD5236503.1 divergent polysaccharide deacetylase family protein [Candidatus Omnitrophota bacterium]MDD5610983.1 divergent polysaccharide deacetylase family protein [Candidatus Omnitrophota bacterium]
MRKSKSRKKPSKPRSGSRKKNKGSPALFFGVIAAILLLLYALPRHGGKKTEITQAGVSVGSYPVAVSEKISPFIPEKIPAEKEAVVAQPKQEKIVYVVQTKEKAEAKPVVAPQKEKNTVVAVPVKKAAPILNTEAKSNVSVKPLAKAETKAVPKEKPTEKNNNKNSGVAFALEQKIPVKSTELKVENPESKLAKSSPVQKVEPKRSNVSPRPRENKIQIAKLPIEILPRIFRPKIKGKIAIVLDDWGYSFEYFNLVKNIRQPLTLAILPNLPYSQRIAVEAKRRGFETILHLPMEPYPKEDLALEKDTITCDMDDLTIKNVVSRQIKRVPYISGVNNHMGSKATEDPRVMRVVFEELKRRNLYFLDSITSNSAGSKVAQQVKIRFTRRDIFLDNENDPAYIKAQLEQLKEEARTRGYAVGIGHARKSTLEVLASEMPKLQKEGFKFVTVSELLK